MHIPIDYKVTKKLSFQPNGQNVEDRILCTMDVYFHLESSHISMCPRFHDLTHTHTHTHTQREREGDDAHTYLLIDYTKLQRS